MCNACLLFLLKKVFKLLSHFTLKKIFLDIWDNGKSENFVTIFLLIICFETFKMTFNWQKKNHAFKV